MEYPQKTLEYLKQLEIKGGEIVADKQEIVALDIRRNECREALRALKKSCDDKCFLAIGPMLTKMTKKQAEDLLLKDQRNVDIEINKIRSNLKEKVNELRDMERLPPVPGLMLHPMLPSELNALGLK